MTTHLKHPAPKVEHNYEDSSKFQVISYQGKTPEEAEFNGKISEELSVIDIFTAIAPEPDENHFYTNLQFALLMYFNQYVSEKCIINIDKGTLESIFEKLGIAYEDPSDLEVAFSSLPDSFIKYRGFGSYIINPSFIKFTNEKRRKYAFFQWNSFGSNPIL